jgi:cellulose synthase/poly-beta-1,6-N-acetylglucosamine synthase-like glycosyltransferase
MKVSAKSRLSIVIPTCNPEERILSRVLRAIESLERDNGSSVECVIVDNNSERPVKELACVKEFLDRCTWAEAIEEPRQGVNFARIAGIKATTAPTIVFFDDDNEPSRNYLSVARRCLEEWPSVAIWGPGRISVVFLDPVPDRFRQSFREAFNERHQQYPEYGCVPASWTHFYPAGMGQVIRREVVEQYIETVESGQLTFMGRMNGSLAGAEDLQLVWEAVKMGYAAGVHPQLQMTHMIPARRSNVPYVKRLTFARAWSYSPALVESFPLERANASNQFPSNAYILKRILGIMSRGLLRLRVRYLTVELAGFLGEIVGALRAAQSKKRQWVFGLVKLLKLE